MSDPSFVDLKRLDKDINAEAQEPGPEVARFAPQKYRSLSGAQSLQAIHTDIRNKTITTLDEDIRRVEEHLTQLKSVRDELKRLIG